MHMNNFYILDKQLLSGDEAEQAGMGLARYWKA